MGLGLGSGLKIDAATARAAVVDDARDHAPVRGLGVPVAGRATVDRQRRRAGVVEAARHLVRVRVGFGARARVRVGVRAWVRVWVRG